MADRDHTDDGAPDDRLEARTDLPDEVRHPNRRTVAPFVIAMLVIAVLMVAMAVAFNLAGQG